ncbi:MAG: hypothetical protein NT014_04770 [Candidatus Omnitrophica bacterium]|nr:hypothetical protein [Candidatus Omnitrophota bacterium]
MNTILLIVTIVFVVPFAIFYIFKMGKTKEADRRAQEEIRRQTGKQVIEPEKKLHEEEKKRWEDEYYKRH